MRRNHDAKSQQPTETPECWSLFDAVIEHCDRLLLHGPSGTGKTRQALSTGLRQGQQAAHVILTEETPAAELRGTWVPTGDRFEWRDGAVVATWRVGDRLVLDEIDHASGDVMSLLMAITDAQETARMILPTLETVRPTHGFSVIATMNGDPDQLPPGLRDRFTVAIEIDAVHPAALAALPDRVRRAAMATALLPAERRLSVRAWNQFALLASKVGDAIAAAAVFGRPRAKDVLDALQLASA